jgi:hypothetical protein
MRRNVYKGLSDGKKNSRNNRSLQVLYTNRHDLIGRFLPVWMKGLGSASAQNHALLDGYIALS